jgi:hypothetical protein
MDAYNYDDFKDHFQKEEWDKWLPSPGFVTDFGLAVRGTETPSMFSTWAALFTLSTMIRRDAWLKWFPKNLYANLYVVLVSPPGVCAKGVPIGLSDDVLRDFTRHIADKVILQKKLMNIRHSKATKEGITDVLKPPPEQRIYDEATKTIKTIQRGSQIALIVSELGTFLGKEQYNIGLIQKLTDFYDCKAVDDDTTKGTKTITLEDIYVTLLGGTNPDSLKDCIPPEAFGDGFLSRVVMAYQDKAVKIYPMPSGIPGAPSPNDLSIRLATLAEMHSGEYHLSEEAQKHYDTWYKEEFHPFRVAKAGTKEFRPRYAIILLKVAMLIRINRYQPGDEITLKDFKEAKKILDATFFNSNDATEDVGAGPYQRYFNRLVRYLKQKGEVQRRPLIQYASSFGCATINVDQMLRDMLEAGAIEVLLNGIKQPRVSKTATEVYKSLNGAEHGKDG